MMSFIQISSFFTFLDLQTGKRRENLISSFHLQSLVKNLGNKHSKNIELLEWNGVVTGKVLFRESIFIIPEPGARYDPHLFLQARPARVLKYLTNTSSFPFKVSILNLVCLFTQVFTMCQSLLCILSI